MNLRTEHLARCIQTLEKSLEKLKRAPEDGIDYEKKKYEEFLKQHSKFAQQNECLIPTDVCQNGSDMTNDVFISAAATGT